MLNSYRQTD